MTRDAAVRLYAPEGPLPVIRATTAVPGEGEAWMNRHREVIARMKAKPRGCYWVNSKRRQTPKG